MDTFDSTKDASLLTILANWMYDKNLRMKMIASALSIIKKISQSIHKSNAEFFLSNIHSILFLRIIFRTLCS